MQTSDASSSAFLSVLMRVAHDMSVMMTRSAGARPRRTRCVTDTHNKLLAQPIGPSRAGY
jgi:hypothetical protein